MLRGKDVNDLHELKRQGLSISEISVLTGYDRKTIRKYLRQPTIPQYGPRTPRPTKLDAFKPYIDERLTAGVWNAVVLFDELRVRGYQGSYTSVKDYVRPRRREGAAVAVRRFETPPGHQAQVDWGTFGRITTVDGATHPLSGFVVTLGYSRAMFADIVTDQTLPTFLHLHEAAFAALGGVPHELLYDRVKTVILGLDQRGEVRWHPQFFDFARYWGFTPRVCPAYRPQTKGKVERGIGYIRKNFLCGRHATDLDDLRGQLRVWLATVANQRVHGTTYRIVAHAWQEEQAALLPVLPNTMYPRITEHLRRVSRDAYVAYEANRYSVPWQAAGKEVIVREIGDVLEIVRDHERLATHRRVAGRHQVVTIPAHHADMPLHAQRQTKAQVILTVAAPQVAVRSLAEYALVAEGEEV